MGSVALNRSKEKDRSSRLVSGDLQWEKGGRQAPARKAPKGEKTKRRKKDGDGRDAGASDERKDGGGGVRTRFNEPEE